MTGHDLVQALWIATLAASVSLLVLMTLPRLLRRRFGADVAYAAWWLLPLVVIAVLLPARTVEVATPVETVAVQAVAPAITVAPAVAPDRAWLWLLVWAAGALGMALRLAWQQRRFVAALGVVRHWQADLWMAQARFGLPALLGAVRPRIVVPEDFEHRFDPRERGLMLAHERQHRRRGDPLANVAVAVARCVFWFNPLVHLAAARFRHDQELACDQAVIAAHPDSRRAYGEAMLKTLMADRQAPLGCHWGFSHPLKERVMQLHFPQPTPWVRRVGAAAVALAVLGAAFAVWSAQTPRYTQAAGKDFIADVRLRVDGGEEKRFSIADDYGKTISFSQEDEAGRRLDVEATVREIGVDRYDIAMVLKRDGSELASPRVITMRGRAAEIRVGEERPGGDFDGVRMSFTVDADPRVSAMAPPAPPPPPPPPAQAPPAPPAPPADAPDVAIPPPAPPAPPGRPASLALPAPVAAPAQPAPMAVPAPPPPPEPVGRAETPDAPRPMAAAERARLQAWAASHVGPPAPSSITAPAAVPAVAPIAAPAAVPAVPAIPAVAPRALRAPQAPRNPLQSGRLIPLRTLQFLDKPVDEC